MLSLLGTISALSFFTSQLSDPGRFIEIIEIFYFTKRLMFSGVICLEGEADECNEAWGTIKAMTWKKVGLKHQEVSK